MGGETNSGLGYESLIHAVPSSDEIFLSQIASIQPTESQRDENPKEEAGGTSGGHLVQILQDYLYLNYPVHNII